MATLIKISDLKEGGSLSGGVFYLKSYSKKSYAEGTKFFIVGNLDDTEGNSVPFKIWEAPLVNALGDNDCQGEVVAVTGEVTSYKGVKELKIVAIDNSEAIEKEYPKTLFMKSVDVPKVYADFTGFINTKLSEKGVKVLMAVFKGERLFARFKEEFAGAKMHDALIGGLMNHTTKMLHIADVLVENDARLVIFPDYKDLLYMGIIMHDMGKVHEMNLGVYQVNSFVTHRTIGVEMLCKYKDVIVSTYNETMFYQLLAIIQGHHHIYGDKATTVMAYIIHLIDLLDSGVTGILDKIERKDTGTFGGMTTVYADDVYLTI